MPRIFDNIDNGLLPALRDAITSSYRADFSVGYFNLLGWKQLDTFIDHWKGGEGGCCRLLVGMHRSRKEEWREAVRTGDGEMALDNETVLKYKRQLALEFRDQLVHGSPTNADEIGLRRLADQIRSGKLVVRLFLRNPLHAKLYLLFRHDNQNPATAFVGSSNLTFSGLRGQGELNVDVLDHDGCAKLAAWFEARWHDRWCVDISDMLVEVIEESWAGNKPVLPYHIYIKIAYHLSREARAGLTEFAIPTDLKSKLFAHQSEAIRIAAHHINKRGGVLIGDVVGLGKTLMATALAKMFDDTLGRALIICPKNLERMWKDYSDTYDLNATILPVSKVTKELPHLRRYRLVIIDESQNLRNREGRRYSAIQNYIAENESRCVLLSATPYNKSLEDLSAQLALFTPRDKDIGVRPEQLIRELGGVKQFERRHQCGPRTLSAFEKSEHVDDWRELMRLYMVRRTRSFIQQYYAVRDGATGRMYLPMSDGGRAYFPTRVPRTVAFGIDAQSPEDQYGRLYSSKVVDTINDLALPRYGLGNYVVDTFVRKPTERQAKQLKDLGRAGKRLMGFSRTNLFKRLESSGQAFLQSIERHILRNYIFLHAIERGEDLPIGTQDSSMLDSANFDEDADVVGAVTGIFDDDTDNASVLELDADAPGRFWTEDGFRARAAAVYDLYATRYDKRFRWLPSEFFTGELRTALRTDALLLLSILEQSGEWVPSGDAKLRALLDLLTVQHPNEKVLVFTQFADTVRYLHQQLEMHRVTSVEGVTGATDDPTKVVRHFSPISNGWHARVAPADELRVLVATDVLSEGQNLQDAHIVVNYDLPWAIIRLIQRAGRVDRIGQKAERIICYSFLPADGVENIIRLRARVRQRLRQNLEVVGTDEAFFEDDGHRRSKEEREEVGNLYNEKSGVLDDDPVGETDLASQAHQIWEEAIRRDPSLKERIPAMQPVVYATRAYRPTPEAPEGVLAYMRTAEGNDALAWIDRDGNSITESQLEILRAAECSPGSPPLRRLENHHDLVARAVTVVTSEERKMGGQLGKPSSARRRVYERMKDRLVSIAGTLFDTGELRTAVDEIYTYPLCQQATDILNLHLRSGIRDEDLADLVTTLRDEGRLCLIQDDAVGAEPRIICSMGLRGEEGAP